MEIMKRILSYILLIAVNLFSLFGNEMLCQAEETKTTVKESELYARSAVLMDADSGRILYEKAGEEQRPMASTTKIMTCILTLEKGNLNELVSVSSYAASMPDVQLNIREGEYYRLGDLLYSLMLESHNDTAVAIAEHIGGSVEGFAKMMNQKAEELGCHHTCFITPNGLDASKEIETEDGSVKTVEHSTTAEDLARIMSYCIKKSPQKEKFLEITRTASYSFTNQKLLEDGSTVAGERSFSCNNHNAFLNMMDGVLSGKTGFTGNAGYCYVGALERDGRTYVVALLACGWPNNKSYKWSDTKKLMNYGIENYQKVDFSKEPVKEEWLKEIPVYGGKTKELFQDTSAKVYAKKTSNAPVILMKPGEKVEISCSVKNKLDAPIEKDQVVGHIQYLVDNNVYWEQEICILDGIEKTDFWWYVNRIIEVFF